MVSVECKSQGLVVGQNMGIPSLEEIAKVLYGSVYAECAITCLYWL